MKMKRHSWSLKIAVTAPFLTGGNESLLAGVDNTLYRDEEGRIALSGAQIAGHFRHFLFQVAAAEKAANEQRRQDGKPDVEPLVPSALRFKWLGRPGRQLRNPEEMEDLGVYEGEAEIAAPDWSADSERARLTFRDLPLKKEDKTPGKHTRTRIRLGEMTGAVAPGAWQILELSHLPGAAAVFEHDEPTVELYGTDEEAKAFKIAFEPFRHALVAIGANKGQGFGRVEADGICLEKRETKDLSIPACAHAGPDDWSVSFELSHPLLVSPKLYSGNLYHGSATIPGSVIKAAIAEFGALACPGFQKEFGAALARMHVSHFRPAEAYGDLPGRERGFDIVKVPKVGEADRPCHIHEAEKKGGRNIFEVDWKDPPKGRWEPKWVTRTRTAVTLGEFTADEHRLFNYQCVSQIHTRWYGRIVLPQKGEQEETAEHEALKEKARQLLAFLKSDVIQIGKLRSGVISVDLKESNPPGAVPMNDGSWRIVLQTPAHLLDIPQIRRLQNGERLQDVYADLLRDVLEPTAATAVDWEKLEIFARHEWAGGRQAVRYDREIGGEPSYYPYLLTKPGTVFILPVAEADAKAQDALSGSIAEIARLGLPSTDRIRGWERAPFLRECGFGDVVVGPPEPLS
ncbi:hypothetical protein NYQ83_12095 [Afifella sp. JA880]|uniref:RAMP superfamily CRISPR-associated protein n=1 Tax=Afifella sp. JA880 TaxID=2975280 RepID=UPI0021BA6350|nr:RAMP superfamily CRISPR-associated protein [Afifella sp. JA880]MCT8268016.1 hypothetical protein [Afifella sp. JA880]